LSNASSGRAVLQPSTDYAPGEQVEPNPRSDRVRASKEAERGSSPVHCVRPTRSQSLHDIGPYGLKVNAAWAVSPMMLVVPGSVKYASHL
jgi:hypothetical protein